MNKKIYISILILIVFVFLLINFYSKNNKVAVADYKNAEYSIEGETVRLVDGFAETETAPGSATKKVTRFFGNEFFTDLDGDGDTDVVFLLTQESGGSGTFFYVVAGLLDKGQYLGSDGYLLGDRVAPQSINQSENPRHKNVVVVNYADRNPGEAMTISPSFGKSVYLKIDSTNTRWAIVMPDFEGESR